MEVYPQFKTYSEMSSSLMRCDGSMSKVENSKEYKELGIEIRHMLHAFNNPKYSKDIIGDTLAISLTKLYNSWNIDTLRRRLLFLNENNINEAIKFVSKQKGGDDTMATVTSEPAELKTNKYLNKYTEKIIMSKNVIFRGAPGTGKTYLAKEIAADIISDGQTTNFNDLTEEQKQQFAFVQFHPSYDYTDFVEGLRHSYPQCKNRA